MMVFKRKDYGTSKQILMFPDHYVAMPQFFSKNSALAVDVDGRKVIKAGTFYPSNDSKAVGVVFNDYDVTDGDVNGAVILHGFIAVDKLPEAPTAEAIAALNNITFLPVKKTVIESVNAADFKVSNQVLTVKLSGTDFSSGVTTTTNWTLTAGDTGLTISSVEKVDANTAKVTFTSGTTAGEIKLAVKAAAVVNGVDSNTLSVAFGA